MMHVSVRIIPLAAVLLIAGCSATSAPATSAPAMSAPGTTGSSTMNMAIPVTSGQEGTRGVAPSRLVGPADFAAAIATRGTVTIDVHVPFEGKIAGTNLMIPYTDIAQQAAELPADHRTELAIYCRTGVMSAIAAKTLASLGYTDVVELHGGMYAWEATGRALVTTP